RSRLSLDAPQGLVDPLCVGVGLRLSVEVVDDVVAPASAAGRTATGTRGGQWHTTTRPTRNLDVFDQASTDAGNVDRIDDAFDVDRDVERVVKKVQESPFQVSTGESRQPFVELFDLPFGFRQRSGVRNTIGEGGGRVEAGSLERVG